MTTQSTPATAAETSSPAAAASPVAASPDAQLPAAKPAVDLRNYAIVTAAYWGFTLTDGALHMLVLLHFHKLGYSPLQLAMLLVLYEVCGILTNLFGGWLGSRFGLSKTLFGGLAAQVAALVLLSLVQPQWSMLTSVVYVMLCYGLSGVGKDLTKMSSKSAVKLVASDGKESTLFKWVAILTGSKNALKGVGFFAGGLLLQFMGFQYALWLMAAALFVILVLAAVCLKQELGKSKEKVKLGQIFSKSHAINVLSAARLFLFGARDVWFAVALPIFLYDSMGWDFAGVGGFIAAWIIGYGCVQAIAPKLLTKDAGAAAGARAACVWGFVLAAIPALIAIAWQAKFYPEVSVLGGLIVFGIVFAVNSAVHSYLILAYSNDDKVAVDVGFYYSANAVGRLTGTLLSGWMYLTGQLTACLWVSALLVLFAAIIAIWLPKSAAVETPAPQSIV